jgi:hypothetical protein
MRPCDVCVWPFSSVSPVASLPLLIGADIGAEWFTQRPRPSAHFSRTPRPGRLAREGGKYGCETGGCNATLLPL